MPQPDQKAILRFIEAALQEDIGDGDHTSMACIPAAQTCQAKLLAKESGIVCGVDIARLAFAYVDPNSVFQTLLPDGSAIRPRDHDFAVKCNTRSLLKVERLVLNTMQRLSGITSLSHRFREEVEGLPVTILDTRKTTPLLRFLEKYAVEVGGCQNYRNGLYDRIMIKDNHIKACGSVSSAIDQVENYLKKTGRKLEITVEVANLNQLKEVLKKGGVQRIMFDNFQPDRLQKGVEIVKKEVETEASGGIVLDNIRSYALTGVDYISVGALTHSAQALDLSLKVV